MRKVFVNADFLLVLVTLMAAISWMFSKEALVEVPPLLFIASRFFMAVIMLSCFSVGALKELTLDSWIASSRVGIIFAIAMCLWVFGLFYAEHLGEGAFITSISFIFVAPLSYFLLGTHMSAAHWWALPVALIGLALLSLNQGFHPEAAQLLFLVASFLFAITFIMNGRLAARISSLALTVISLSYVAALAFVLSFFFETWPQGIGQETLIWVALSAVVGTAGRFLLQTYAQGLTPPSHAAIIMVLEPMWTAILAAFWFDERMSFWQATGCGLILLALLISRWSFIRQVFSPKH